MFFKKKEKSYDEDVVYAKKKIIEYCNRSLELECNREKNIIRNCKTMIECNSILLVPLVTVMIELLNRLENVRLFVIIFGLVLIAIVFVSIFFAVLGGQVFKEAYTLSASELMDFINTHDSTSQYDYFYDQTITDLESIYLRKRDNNDKRIKRLFVSKLLNYSFYILTFVFAMVIMILM